METMNEIPSAPAEALNRSFLVDETGRDEITSVDCSCTGLYVVIGCSNGAVISFNLASNAPQHHGLLIGQIICKGLHSSLAMRVKVSDDSRFCFAGVSRGSNELLAIDMGHLKWKWPEYFGSKGSGRKSLPQVLSSKDEVNLFETFVCADAKLKGFASCCTTVHDPSANGYSRYLLACGLGIKNVHVWELTIHNEKQDINGTGTLRKDHWRCLYDVPTNGNTITHMGFRHNGQELITKSGLVNLRVWDLATATPNTRPAYEDIANTQDIKCLLEQSDFAYGGVYEFTMVTVDRNTPKEANRSVLELPENVSNTNNRRRNVNRQVTQVIGTSDGDHVLVLVADGGGIMHYYHPTTTAPTASTATAGACTTAMETEEQEDDEDDHKNNNNSNNNNNNNSSSSSSSSSSSMGCLTEYPSPAKEGDIEQAWALRRVGQQGHVLVLRTFFRPDSAPSSRPSTVNTNGISTTNGLDSNALPLVKGSTIISTFLLSALSKDIPMTTKEKEGDILSWHPHGRYYRSNAVIDPELIRALSPRASNSSSTAADDDDSNDCTHSPPTAAGGKENNQPSQQVSSPVGVTGSGVFNSAELIRSKKRKNEAANDSTVTTTNTAAVHHPLPPPKQARGISNTSVSSVSVGKNALQQQFEQAANSVMHRPVAQRKAPSHAAAYTNNKHMVYDDGSSMMHGGDGEDGLTWSPLKIPPLTIAKPFIPSTTILPMSTLDAEMRDLKEAISTLVVQWERSLQSSHYSDAIVKENNDAAVIGLGSFAFQQLGRALHEQERLKVQFITAIKHYLNDHLEALISSVSKGSGQFFTKIIQHHHMLVIDELHRHQLDMHGAIMRDLILSATYASSGNQMMQNKKRVVFRYADMFHKTQVLGQQVTALLQQKNRF